jgi:hypothetical protein
MGRRSSPEIPVLVLSRFVDQIPEHLGMYRTTFPELFQIIREPAFLRNKRGVIKFNSTLSVVLRGVTNDSRNEGFLYAKGPVRGRHDTFEWENVARDDERFRVVFVDLGCGSWKVRLGQSQIR